MFLLRSAFWLTLMFIIIAPKDQDLGKSVAAASQEALEAGQKAVVAQILASDCSSLECAGGKAAFAVLAGNKLPSIGVTAKDMSSSPVPLPRPRPDRMG
jgi:hypothetical protein